jgi:hypothetical protein
MPLADAGGVSVSSNHPTKLKWINLRGGSVERTVYCAFGRASAR